MFEVLPRTGLVDFELISGLIFETTECFAQDLGGWAGGAFMRIKAQLGFDELRSAVIPLGRVAQAKCLAEDRGGPTDSSGSSVETVTPPHPPYHPANVRERNGAQAIFHQFT